MVRAPRKPGRKPKGNDPRQATMLQATLLSQAASVGIPVPAETLDRVAQQVARFSSADLKTLEAVAASPLALEALARLSVEDPDAFLKHFTNLMEFSKPKLARVEHTGNAHGVGVFVAVEQREAGPPPKLADKVVSDQ